MEGGSVELQIIINLIHIMSKGIADIPPDTANFSTTLNTLIKFQNESRTRLFSGMGTP